MALIDRLAGFSGGVEDFRRIPLDHFWAHLVEMSQGRVTRQNMIDRFELDASETTELDWLIGKYNAQPTAAAKERFIELTRVFLVMAEGGFPGYATNADLTAKLNAL